VASKDIGLEINSEKK